MWMTPIMPLMSGEDISIKSLFFGPSSYVNNIEMSKLLHTYVLGFIFDRVKIQFS